MSRRRRKPTRTDKLAAALLARGEVPYDDAKQMTAEQFISLYQWHHNVRHAEGGSDDYWNLEPMLIAAHRERTAKVDVPEMTRNDHARSTHQEHLERMAAKEPGKSAHVRSRWFRRR